MQPTLNPWAAQSLIAIWVDHLCENYMELNRFLNPNMCRNRSSPLSNNKAWAKGME